MGKLIENLLPEEIIEEILYKLPVKSLLRFNCVSKRWRFMISCKRFAKEHLRKKSTSTDDSGLSHHHRLLYSPYQLHNYAGSDTLRSIFHEPDSLGPSNLQSQTNSSDSFDLQSSFVATFSEYLDATSILIWGSCNGLILMSSLYWDSESLFIWNPATRQAKKIPPPSSSHHNKHNFLHGFGYDESTDDYKVVSISTDSEPFQTQIFSSRTGSWKKIEFSDKSFRVIWGTYGKFVNGKLHWMLEANNEKWEIVSLDLVEERYEIVGGPEHLSDIAATVTPYVTDLSGYLSLITLTKAFGVNTTYKINIWVMMKYGETQSWAKIWKHEEDYVRNGRIPYAMPLWLLKNGDLAVALGEDVFVYNGQDKLCKSTVRVWERIDSAIYFESLVSPFGDEDPATSNQ